MDPIWLGVIGIVALIGMMVLGMPIAFSMFLVGGVGIIYTSGLPGLYAQGKILAFNWSYNFMMAVIPLFILMGYIIAESGIAEDLFYAFRLWVGRLPGGLAVATALSSAGFAAMSSSSLAAVVLFNKIAMMPMINAGYHKRVAAGVITVAGTLAVMIPPSILLIFIGVLTGESIGQLLLAGFLPGLLSAIMFSIVSVILGLRGLAPPIRERVTLKEKIVALRGTWGVILMILIIMGGIYGGIFSPTEAGAMGVFGSIVIMLSRRKFSWKALRSGLMSAASTVGMIFALLIGALLLSRFFVLSGFVGEIGNFLLGLDMPPLALFASFIVMYILLGTFMTAGSMIIVTLPFVYPTVIGLGFSGVWLGILLVKMAEIASVTPPEAMNLYVCNLTAPKEANLTLIDVMIGTVPYLIADLVTTTLLLFFPIIALFLPNTMMAAR